MNNLPFFLCKFHYKNNNYNKTEDKILCLPRELLSLLFGL